MLLLIFFFAFSSTFFSQYHDINSKIVATAGTHKIYVSDWADRYENYLFSTGMSDKFNIRKEYLNNMIDEIILRFYTDNTQILQNPEYKREVDWLKKQAILAFLKDQEVYAKIKVSDEEARKAYLQMNQEIAVRHLFVESKSEADNFYQRLSLGFSFEQLAKEVFTDSILANNGGYLGYHTWGDFDPAFEKAAFNLKVGEISKPVKTEFGYSIIRVDDKQTKPLLTEHDFQLKKKQIVRAVKINLKKPATEKYINRLINFSEIKINNGCLDKIFEVFQTDSLKNIKIFEKKKSTQDCIFYKGQSYSQKWILNKLNQLPVYKSKKITEIRKLIAIIKGIILQEKLLNIAHNLGYDKNKLALATFEKQKMLLFVNYKKLFVLKDLKLPDTTIYKYYLDHQKFFSTHNEINIQEIIVKTKFIADSLVKELTRGADFGKLAKKFSIRKSTAKKNGVVGFVSLAKFSSFSEKFWGLTVGDIVGPIEINGFYGIFKILGKRPSKPLKFRSIKDDVEIAAKYTMQKVYFQKYISEIRKKVKIYINEAVLGSRKIQKYGIH